MTDRKMPATSPRRTSGKNLTVKVVLLDDTVNSFQVPARVPGQELFNAVVKKLKLLEIDYFDLEFLSKDGRQCWLDHAKTLPKQCPPNTDLIFYFSVKFYPPDPHLLEDEFTRFLFALQIKRDLVNGLLPCTDNTLCLLASYLVQAEIGDFLDEEYLDTLYLTQLKVLPNQPTEELLLKVMEYHKAHIGLSPEESEYSLLDTARKVDLYGIRLHQAKDHEGLPLNLAVAHAGVLVFQNTARINTFSWAKVRKLSFKRKKFLVKLHPEGYGYYKDTVEFFFDTRDECKMFWKKCIEHHTFFRCQGVKMQANRSKPKVVSKGSSFRYCGRTQKQLVEFVRENYVKRPHFDRGSGPRSLPSRSPAARRAHGGGSYYNSTLNSSSARSHTSTSSGSHTLLMGDLASSREYMQARSRTMPLPTSNHRSVSVSPPARRGPPLHFRARSLPDDDGAPDEDVADDTLPPPPAPLPLNGSDNEAEEMEGPDDDLLELPPPSLPPSIPPDFPPPLLRLGSPDGNSSMPSFSHFDHPTPPPPMMINNHRLHRSPEVEDIPEGMNDDDDELPPPLSRQHYTAPSLRSYTNEHRPASTILGDREETTIIQDTEFLPKPPLPLPLPQEDEEEEEMNGQVEERPTRGPLSVASHTLALSGVSSIRSGVSDGESDVDARSTTSSTYRSRRSKHQFPAEPSYYLCKELVMTERAYKRDLETVCEHFRKDVACNSKSDIPADLLHSLYTLIDPIYDEHVHLLRELEQRLHSWEKSARNPDQGEPHKVADVLLRHMRLLPLYRKYMDSCAGLLLRFHSAIKESRLFEEAVRRFEAQKLCYLPLTCFLLSPNHRLLHYRNLCERLLEYYDSEHPDHQDCRLLHAQLLDVLTNYQTACDRAEQVNQLTELQRDIVGAENFLSPQRQPSPVFIRLGWLKKLSKRGFAPRLFFLLSDRLFYASRVVGSFQLLKLHGEMPLQNLVVEDAGYTNKQDTEPFTFTVSGGRPKRAFVLAANSQRDKDLWMAELGKTADGAPPPDISLSDPNGVELAERHHIQQRSFYMTHVCWHRCATISFQDVLRCNHCKISSHLLRKFKNSNGWQRLWVVFSNFSLFFYKSYHDEAPMATLPLIGYDVTLPDDNDKTLTQGKSHVFKIKWKHHEYFFRTECQHTFDRWFEVLSSAICPKSSDKRYSISRHKSKGKS